MNKSIFMKFLNVCFKKPSFAYYLLIVLFNTFICMAFSLFQGSVACGFLAVFNVFLFPFTIKKSNYFDLQLPDKRRILFIVISAVLSVCFGIFIFFASIKSVYFLKIKDLIVFPVSLAALLLAGLCFFCSFFVFNYYILHIFYLFKNKRLNIVIFVVAFIGLSVFPVFLLYKIPSIFLVFLLCISFETLIIDSQLKSKVIKRAVVSFACAVCALGIVTTLFWEPFISGFLWGFFAQKDYSYSDQTFFKNKNVMIIVPHEDDDVNLAGGIIKQYKQNNSHVTLLYATNGDFCGVEIGKQRLDEALTFQKMMLFFWGMATDGSL